MTYGYRQLKTQLDASFHQCYAEYTPAYVETEHFTTGLAVLRRHLPDRPRPRGARPHRVRWRCTQHGPKAKTTSTRFQDASINGDTAVDAHGFDGLDNAHSTCSMTSSLSSTAPRP